MINRQSTEWKQSRLATLLWFGISREGCAHQLGVSLKTVNRWAALPAVRSRVWSIGDHAKAGDKVSLPPLNGGN